MLALQVIKLIYTEGPKGARHRQLSREILKIIYILAQTRVTDADHSRDIEISCYRLRHYLLTWSFQRMSVGDFSHAASGLPNKINKPPLLSQILNNHVHNVERW